MISEFNGKENLTDAEKIIVEKAKLHAEIEFEKYKIILNRLFMADFDKYILELEEQSTEKII